MAMTFQAITFPFHSSTKNKSRDFIAALAESLSLSLLRY
jgi:hypothetical protein